MKKYLMILLFLLIFLTGCNTYDAIIYQNVNKYLKDEVLDRDLKYYIYPDGTNPDRDSYFDWSINNTYYLIDSEEKHKKLFNSFPSAIDFEKEMLCVILFYDCYSREHKIMNIMVQNEILKISIKEKKPFSLLPYGGAHYPIHRGIAIKLNKLDVNEVVFVIR